MSRSDLISIVVTTYNRSDALCAVLRSLAAQQDRQFEIVVADDGSTPQQQEAIGACASRLGVPVCHVWHPDVGFTAARVRNLGVAAAAGSYIVLLDGDCVVETDFVQRHRALAEPGCYVNGSRVLLSERLTRQVLAGQCQVYGRNALFWLRQRLRGDASKLTGLLRLPDGQRRIRSDFYWKGIRSCNMGVWRSDYLAVNGFDESFVGWGHEDADFALRLHNRGIRRKNGFCATEVYHLWHKLSVRLSESRNAATVRERMRTGQVQAPTGYSQSEHAADMVLRRWN